MSERQPIFNVPGVVVALLGSFVAVHLVRYLLPEEQAAWLTAVLAFIPARLTGMAHELPGGDVASVTQFVTHHVRARRCHPPADQFGVVTCLRQLRGAAHRCGEISAFFSCAALPAPCFTLAFSRGALSMMVGASGAISGLMGAAFRFLFQALSEGDTEGLAGEDAPAAPDEPWRDAA